MSEPLFCALAGIAFGFAVSAWSSLKRVDERIDTIDARSREAEESAERAELVVSNIEQEVADRAAAADEDARELERQVTELRRSFRGQIAVDRAPPEETKPVNIKLKLGAGLDEKGGA